MPKIYILQEFILILDDLYCWRIIFMHGYVLDLILAFSILLCWNDVDITDALSIFLF